MAFDDSTGGLDRHLHHTPEPVWGNEWGDGKPRQMFAAARTAFERAEVDQIAHQKYLERRAKIAADAQRRRSAPVEAKIEADLLRGAKSSMGAALLKAFANQPKVRPRDRERKAEKALE